MWTVASLHIKGKEATLQMVQPKDDLILCPLETQTKDTAEVQLKCFYTVLDVKRIVEGITNLPCKDWDLFKGGKQLQNVKTLAYYDIGENENLKMLLEYPEYC